MTDWTRPAGQGPSDGGLVPDFDRLPASDLRNRIRSLTLEQLRELLAHEEGHGRRADVVELLRARMELLAASQGLPPTGPGRPGAGPGAGPARE
ncbi:hypothetical protein LO771_20110 [Streptacidiphilus sp. ASG 303]|uniref:hypothetical protein n=1 Tax=Streptacidiphilus sp. ASG 303 TaxID=2896847 RepID=UPI001E488294|nr:hypothetical protein [Streptacidiphilus sp. ASG 303]MCD0484633.1 hypothetical protein [Streptacidiphilus sp. ASG 303]